MLTGRESLVRLVGKRRRFLPHRHSILSAPVQFQSLNTLCTDEDGGGIGTTERLSEDKAEGLVLGSGGNGENLVQVSNSDWVNCPVCGCKVCGEDNNINSHLDSCLSRGTKRKLTQRTLLQLNFCSGSHTRKPSSEVEKSVANVICDSSCNGVLENPANGFKNYGDVEENDSIPCKLPLPVELVDKHTEDGSYEKPICTDGINSLKDEIANNGEAMTVNDIIGVILETFIVGRRFSDEKELKVGANILLLREPNNSKDPNAIKVVLDDSRCCKVLGFLPRELAQYMSPLIEKYSLIFQGCVTSVPKHALDVVPIQIACGEAISNSDIDQFEIESFTCIWNNILRVVNSSKNYSPNREKYQQNFCLFLREVVSSNPHLFSDDEKIFMESFLSMSDDSQRLFVRLYARKGPWFRISNISYPEVLDTRQAIEGLCAIGYIYVYKNKNELESNDLMEILNLLTMSELREIALMFIKNCTRARKQDVVASLISSFREGLCPLLPTSIMDRSGTCIKITPKAESVIWRAERFFFLNGEQNLSAFLLVDLGIVKYPNYNCIISEPVFSTRSDLLAYEEAIEVAQIMDESLDDNNIESVLNCINIAKCHVFNLTTKENQSKTSELLATFLSCFSASWVYSKVVSLGVSFLEREHRYRDAVNLLKQLLICFLSDGRRGYWTLRLSIDLEHIGCPNESLSVAEVGLQDPWVRAGARMALQRRVIRLGKPPRRWKIPSFSDSIKRKIREVHIQGRPLNCEAGMKSRFYGEDGEQCGVEQLALQYYASEGGGWQGVHTESGIWLTIFGLLMWDVIFCDIPNVFRNRFQTAPLDLETDSFYLLRERLIESHLQKIYDGMAEEILITSWELHSGMSCRGVNWDRHSLSELRAAVTCIRGPCLASLCRHLAQDYRSWSSGMPDLLLWRFHGEYRGEAKLVEVKGPRDRLSEQQRAWLLVLMDCGFDTEVCKVSPIPISA